MSGFDGSRKGPTKTARRRVWDSIGVGAGGRRSWVAHHGAAAALAEDRAFAFS